MSTMTLFHSPLSPFVRKVMVVLHETGQLDRVALQPVNISPVSGDEQLNRGNPIGKIPALRLEDGTVLHDSRVICEYLDLQHVGTPLIPVKARHAGVA
ncbi:putative GST-like protein YibF [Pseudomonas sp. Teo4]|nr:putative GST-like protein YibF [Pseudomonas sp. Teo4]